MKKQCLHNCISTNANGFVTRENSDSELTTSSRIFCFSAFGDLGTRICKPKTRFRKKGSILPIGPRSCNSPLPQFLHSFTRFPPEFQQFLIAFLSEVIATSSSAEVSRVGWQLQEEYLPGTIDLLHLIT